MFVNAMFFHIISLKLCPLPGGCHGNGAYVPKQEANQKRDPPSIAQSASTVHHGHFTKPGLQTPKDRLCIYLLVYIIYLCLTVEWECEIKNLSFYFGSYII